MEYKVEVQSIQEVYVDAVDEVEAATKALELAGKEIVPEWYVSRVSEVK